jgi:hypothetical protein
VCDVPLACGAPDTMPRYFACIASQPITRLLASPPLLSRRILHLALPQLLLQSLLVLLLPRVVCSSCCLQIRAVQPYVVPLDAHITFPFPYT